jgi:hypothetical protein
MVIVHALRIRAGMILYVDGNSLAEISFEAIDAHPKQALQVTSVPIAGFRICEVDDRHAALPQVGLPDSAITTFKIVPVRAA